MTGLRSANQSVVPNARVANGMDGNVRGVLEDRLGVWWKDREEVRQRMLETKQELVKLKEWEANLSYWIKSLETALR